MVKPLKLTAADCLQLLLMDPRIFQREAALQRYLREWDASITRVVITWEGVWTLVGAHRKRVRHTAQASLCG